VTAYVAFVVPEIDLVLAQTLKEEKDEERKIKRRDSGILPGTPEDL
jgi:hypothetical protein